MKRSSATSVSYTHLEHHRFLAVLVDDVGHFLHQTGDLAALECLKILVLLGGHAVSYTHLDVYKRQVSCPATAVIFAPFASVPVTVPLETMGAKRFSGKP